jgi:hypothetical protein
VPSFVSEDTILNEDDIRTLEGYEDERNINYEDERNINYGDYE